VGGMAIIQAGYFRATDDIDILVETMPENEARVIEGLLILQDKAAAELKPGEVEQYGVVRVADEVLVDLMKSGCGITYADAIKDAVTFDIAGVPIPFASPLTLWRMKQTPRARDIPDRLYLQQLLKAQGVAFESAGTSSKEDPITRWLNRLQAWWQRQRQR